MLKVAVAFVNDILNNIKGAVLLMLSNIKDPKIMHSKADCVQNGHSPQENIVLLKKLRRL